MLRAPPRPPCDEPWCARAAPWPPAGAPSPFPRHARPAARTPVHALARLEYCQIDLQMPVQSARPEAHRAASASTKRRAVALVPRRWRLQHTLEKQVRELLLGQFGHISPRELLHVNGAASEKHAAYTLARERVSGEVNESPEGEQVATALAPDLCSGRERTSMMCMTPSRGPIEAETT